MANATRDRNTIKKLSTEYQPQMVLNMPASATAYYGVMKCSDANHRAVDPGGGNSALNVLGVVKQRVDNSTGAADAKKVELETGVFIFANSGDITAAHIGNTCYAVDNQTVSITATGNSECGKVMDVSTSGVEVWIGVATHITAS